MALDANSQALLMAITNQIDAVRADNAQNHKVIQGNLTAMRKDIQEQQTRMLQNESEMHQKFQEIEAKSNKLYAEIQRQITNLSIGAMDPSTTKAITDELSKRFDDKISDLEKKFAALLVEPSPWEPRPIKRAKSVEGMRKRPHFENAAGEEGKSNVCQLVGFPYNMAYSDLVVETDKIIKPMVPMGTKYEIKAKSNTNRASIHFNSRSDADVLMNKYKADKDENTNGIPFVDSDDVDAKHTVFLKYDKSWAERRMGSCLSILWKLVVARANANGITLKPGQLISIIKEHKLLLKSGKKLLELLFA